MKMNKLFAYNLTTFFQLYVTKKMNKRKKTKII